MEDLIVEFVSSVKGLSKIEDLLPKRSNKYLPDWWKETKHKSGITSTEIITVGNVKNCPSFPDYFSQGFVVPMWCDSILKYSTETPDKYYWRTSSANFEWSCHSPDQFLDDVNFQYQNKKGIFVFKTTSPWKLITPPGYSVLQLPIFYDFDAEFSVLPGIIHTDVHHEINHSVMIYESNKDIIIRRGTPFVQYVPFKRTDYGLDVRDATEEDLEKFTKHNLYMDTWFSGSARYQKLRKYEKDREKDL